ncbi:hypothetical protein BN000_02198 [Mycobacterium europaeum]|uniref:Uncharacterized protein n=1 Tax=Mycobacterium europaeum TaxID=761804 RepID=A0A0U1DAP6_9MYCO|nr:hypothetical protein [Mycobacterium europaeum]CQD10639.1 hypothetical protein BN000_02198 [Mycobacterium europaeum]
MKIPKDDGSGGFWVSSHHREDDQPKPRRDKVIKLRLLQNQYGQLWTVDGPRRELKRGDEIRMTREQGLRMVGNGVATQDLETDVTDLPTMNLDKTPEAVAAQRHPVIKAANERLQAMVRPKVEPTQEQIDANTRYLDFIRRRRERLSGWIGA